MAKVIINNYKGGMGKSLISHQLITGSEFFGIEIDTFGNLSDRLPEQVQFIPVDEDFEIPDEMNIVVDMGGYKDHREDYLIEGSTLIVVPFVPTLESVMSTMSMLESIKHHNTPFLFVANMVKKGKKMEALIEDALKNFREILGNREIESIVIPQSDALRTAINENVSVIELANRPGIRGTAYRPIAKKIQELIEIVESYA